VSILVIHNSNLIGARNQALGVARVLAQQFDPNEDIVIARIVTRKGLRGIVHVLHKLGLLNKAFKSNSSNSLLWKLLFYGSSKIERPFLIVSTLGKTEHTSVALANLYGVPNIYVGEPKYFDPSSFNLIVTAYSSLTAENRLSLETVPTHLLVNDVNKAAQNFRAHNNLKNTDHIWSFLIGGDCDGYNYDEIDWQNICKIMQRNAEKHKIRWVLSTSRRTGAHAENILKRCLSGADWLIDATWWNDAPKPILAAYIGVSDICFVTEESLSMLSDCVSLGKPVYACSPERHTAQSGINARRIGELLEKLVSNKRVVRLSLASSNETVSVETRNVFHLSGEEERWDIQLINKAKKRGIL